MLTHLPKAIIILVILPFSLVFRPSEAACGNAVYWGHNGGSEGTLEAACNSKSSEKHNYAYVNVGFLSTFGNDQLPILDLPFHCPRTGSCPGLATNISYCQSQDIKVFLSLGGPTGRYSLLSPDDAQQVASYVYLNYLGGGGSSGPLGDSYFDGIDFDIQNPGSNRYWDSLATALSQYSTPSGNVLLSASPRCTIPDPYLDAAIKTGLFNYVWVKFYDNPTCDIRASTFGLIESFQQWSSYLAEYSPVSQLLMGLPASTTAAEGGYIDPSTLSTLVMPDIRQVYNYGGLMLWNRYYDIENTYSSKVVPFACVGLAPSREEQLVISQVV